MQPHVTTPDTQRTPSRHNRPRKRVRMKRDSGWLAVFNVVLGALTIFAS